MSEIRNFIKSSIFKAALEIKKSKSKGLSIYSKARNDKATSADLAAEKAIVNQIKKHFPDSIILSEENFHPENILVDSLFVIDPIDGTHNFIQNIPIYGISVAHYSQGKPNAGGVLLLPQNDFYFAEKGKQSTLNGKKISVSKTKKLEDFFFLCDSRLHLAQELQILDNLVKLEKLSQHTRFLGSAVYEMCYVADGRVDASIGFKFKPYDFAASAFIAQQAGAKITDLQGKAWDLFTKSFLVSNAKQHKQILEILNGSR